MSEPDLAEFLAEFEASLEAFEPGELQAMCDTENPEVCETCQ